MMTDSIQKSAIRRMTLVNRPYAQFNFLVKLGEGADDRVDAGFQECSTISRELRSAEYGIDSLRSKEFEITTRKTPLSQVRPSNSLILKRGVINCTVLRTLLDDVQRNPNSAGRTIVIKIQNEERSGPMQSWKLQNARLTKHSSGPLNAKGTDVAMEELILAYERLEIE